MPPFHPHSSSSALCCVNYNLSIDCPSSSPGPPPFHKSLRWNTNTLQPLIIMTIICLCWPTYPHLVGTTLISSSSSSKSKALSRSGYYCSFIGLTQFCAHVMFRVCTVGTRTTTYQLRQLCNSLLHIRTHYETVIITIQR